MKLYATKPMDQTIAMTPIIAPSRASLFVPRAMAANLLGRGDLDGLPEEVPLDEGEDVASDGADEEQQRVAARLPESDERRHERDNRDEEEHQDREDLPVRPRDGVLHRDIVQPLLPLERDVLVREPVRDNSELLHAPLGLTRGPRPRWRRLLGTARACRVWHRGRYPRLLA